MEKLKVFLSQPMKGKSKEAIDRERHVILDSLPSLLSRGDILEIPMLSEITSATLSPVHCLGLSIQDMSAADVVVFAPGWRNARGCVVEHAVALLYEKEYVELQKAQDEYYVSVDGRRPDGELQEG